MVVTDFAADLFGRGVVQGEGARAGAGDARRLRWSTGRAAWRCRSRAGSTSPAGGHQDVRRLQVAMHDQVGVRMADRLADLQEQVQARAHVEAARARSSR